MIKMKRTYLLVLILFLSVSLSAQKDKQAREILDKTANALQQAGGIRATFGGTGNGTLLLKGNQFYLNSGGIQSWFDGKTQWSYLESSEEVNVSNPTPEELQTINPYALLSIYKNGYNYSFCLNHFFVINGDAVRTFAQVGGSCNTIADIRAKTFCLFAQILH